MNGEEGHNSQNNDYSTTTITSFTSQNQNFWIEEALQNITAYISDCVISAGLSDILTSKEPSATCAYINIETLESQKICIKLSPEGYIIVGNNFDDNSLDNPDLSKEQKRVFESPESLLQSISPSYNSRFASQLYQKLAELAKKS